MTNNAVNSADCGYLYAQLESRISRAGQVSDIKTNMSDGSKIILFDLRNSSARAGMHQRVYRG